MVMPKMRVEINGIETILKWMNENEPVQSKGESGDHYAGYMECWEGIKRGLESLLNTKEE